MNIRLLFISLLLLNRIVGYTQHEIFNIVYDYNIEGDQPKGVDRYIEKKYELKLNNNYKIDTILTIDGIEQPYSLHYKREGILQDSNTWVIKEYDRNDTLQSIMYKRYNDANKLVMETVQFFRPEFQSMNSVQQMEYDGYNRLVRKEIKACDTCEIVSEMSIKYDAEGNIDTMEMFVKDTGKQIYSQKQKGDTTRYEVFKEFGQKYLENLKRYEMTVEDLPTEYIDVVTLSTGECLYRGYKKEKNRPASIQWEKVRNKDNHITLIKRFNEGKLRYHMTYNVNPSGTVNSAFNMLNHKTYKNELNAADKYTVRSEGLGSRYFNYNEQGNWDFMGFIPTGVKYYEYFLVREY